MKENLLRGMIRKQIKSSLKEAPMTSTRVEKGLGRVEKMAGVKMLKKALGQGSITQQASGLLAVVKAISGDNPMVAKTLARMIQKQGIGANEVGAVAENSALDTKLAKVDKTQAMKILKQQLGNKSASVQSEFVLNLLNGLGLKDSAKQRLKMKIRQDLK